MGNNHGYLVGVITITLQKCMSFERSMCNFGDPKGYSVPRTSIRKWRTDSTKDQSAAFTQKNKKTHDENIINAKVINARLAQS